MKTSNFIVYVVYFASFVYISTFLSNRTIIGIHGVLTVDSQFAVYLVYIFKMLKH